MATDKSSAPDEELLEVDLREPKLAVLLAWLWPGAGHLYQRRYAKGVLFMVCILGTYFFGLTMGGGHVVYASWKENDRRWQYFCQLGVGAPALPALVQSMRVKSGKPPLFLENYYRRIRNVDDRDLEIIDDPSNVDEHSYVVYAEAFMAPPGEVDPNNMDLLAKWHERYHAFFELGTLFTVIAGLLNVLAIYDAYAGPAAAMPEPKTDKPPPDEKKKKRKSKA